MNNEKLIQLVKQHELLYNVKHPNYYNRDLRAAIWKEISEQMKISEAEVRNKWQNIRSNFTRELRKLRTSASGSQEDENEVSWPLFPLLSFLDDSLCMQESKGNVLDQSEETVTIDNFVEIKLEEGRTNSIYATCETDESCNTSSNTHTSPGNSSFTLHPVTKKCKLRKQTTNNEDEIDKRYLNHIEELPSSGDNNDPDLLFFKSLLPQIKKLNSSDNLCFKVEVAQLLLWKLQANTATSPSCESLKLFHL